MKKRGVGLRMKSVIDELDLMIFTELGESPKGVLELQKILNVQHKTLKIHLDKLKKFNLINVENLEQNKKRLTLTKPVIKFIEEYDELLRKFIDPSKN